MALIDHSCLHSLGGGGEPEIVRSLQLWAFPVRGFRLSFWPLEVEQKAFEMDRHLNSCQGHWQTLQPHSWAAGGGGGSSTFPTGRRLQPCQPGSSQRATSIPQGPTTVPQAPRASMLSRRAQSGSIPNGPGPSAALTPGLVKTSPRGIEMSASLAKGFATSQAATPTLGVEFHSWAAQGKAPGEGRRELGALLAPLCHTSCTGPFDQGGERAGHLF